MPQAPKRLLTLAERHPYLPLLLILLLGLGVRAFLLPGPGFALDLGQFREWANCAIDNGLFNVFPCMPVVTYPPLTVTGLTGGVWLFRLLGGDASYLEGNPWLLVAIKLPSLLFELGLGGEGWLRAPLDAVRARADDQDRWLLEHTPRNMWTPFGRLREPNKWVTLRALKVLRAANNQAQPLPGKG